MLVPLSWLRDFTPVDAGVDDLVAALNSVGLEVEGVEEPGREIGGIVVAKVLDVMRHPNADKLTLVDVDRGDGQTRVVCGATNVVPGMVVPYAPAGATLPGGVRLERRKIRGETSDGMLCSARELGLGEDHEGILGLDGGAPIGADVRDVLGLDDVILDISVTPNRPDAMCVVGVAREVAAAFGTPLDVPVPAAAPTEELTSITVSIEAPDRCPRYLGWAARVALGPSPAWMQQRLIKAGMRPISNVVDVTNYVLLERNQPLHAFDLGRLPGDGIVVRLAKKNEKITTLDGIERALDREDLLICDAKSKPQAIAGIMGGRESEVDDATTEILLEAAYFERMGIARSSKRLKLRSESSARFERGIDPEAVALNASRAMELLAQVAGGAAGATPVDDYPEPAARPIITLRTSKVNRLLGTTLTDAEVLDALRPLEIAVSGEGDDIQAVPPSFRPDLEREVDLVEEVARRVGFETIGRTVPKPRDQVGGLSHGQRDRRLVADALVGAGLFEAITVPFLDPAMLEASGAPTEGVVRIANPLRAEDSALRTAVVPGLLRTAAANQARGMQDIALFEIGRVFRAVKGELLPAQPLHAGAVLVGGRARGPVEADRAVDVYDAVDALQGVLEGLEIAEHRLVPTSRPGFHVSRAAAIEVDGTDVGTVGEVSTSTSEALGVSGTAVGFELDLDAVVAAKRRDRAFVPPSPFPPATIDLAFVLARDVPAADVLSTVIDAGGGMVEDARCFDEFRSDALGPGNHSLAFRVRYRAPDRTLTDEEVGELRQQAIRAVEQRHGGELRGEPR